MNKKDQEAIANLYIESTGYTGETNDLSDHKSYYSQELSPEQQQHGQSIANLKKELDECDNQLEYAAEKLNSANSSYESWSSQKKYILNQLQKIDPNWENIHGTRDWE